MPVDVPDAFGRHEVKALESVSPDLHVDREFAFWTFVPEFLHELLCEVDEVRIFTVQGVDQTVDHLIRETLLPIQSSKDVFVEFLEKQIGNCDSSPAFKSLIRVDLQLARV